MAALSQKVGEKPDRLGVALDRALALVLRAERPAEATVQCGEVSSARCLSHKASYLLVERCAGLHNLLGPVLKGCCVVSELRRWVWGAPGRTRTGSLLFRRCLSLDAVPEREDAGRQRP